MLSVDASLFVIFLIVWILVVILTKTFFNPIRKVMQDRDKGLDQYRQITEKAAEEYELTILKIEKDIKEAKAEAYAIRDEFEKAAAQEKARMLGEVSQECRIKINEAQKKLKTQAENLKKELETESEMLAEKIEQRLLH